MEQKKQKNSIQRTVNAIFFLEYRNIDYPKNPLKMLFPKSMC